MAPEQINLWFGLGEALALTIVGAILIWSLERSKRTTIKAQRALKRIRR